MKCKIMFNEVLDKDSDINLSNAFANAKKMIEQWKSEKELPSSFSDAALVRGFHKHILDLLFPRR